VGSQGVKEEGVLEAVQAGGLVVLMAVEGGGRSRGVGLSRAVGGSGGGPRPL
jgi:hypothetical protein